MKENIIAKIHNSEKIYIFGAGGVADDVIRLLKYQLIKKTVQVVVTSIQNNPVIFNGFSVVEKKKIFADTSSKSALVIISLMSNTAKKIKKEFQENQFSNLVIADEIADGLYKEAWKKPIENRKIVFSNFKGRGYGCNPKYICSRLLPKDYDLVWAVQGDHGDCFPKGVRTVEYGSFEYYMELATARVWVDNTHKNILTKKRSGQFYIQTWHGCGPLKKIDYDATEKLTASYLKTVDFDVNMVDLCVSGAQFCSVQYRRAFRYNGKIIESGCPRNDIFWTNKDYKSMIASADADKLWVLYAPTIREMESNVLDTEKVIECIEKKYNRECILLIREHPQMKMKEGRYEFNGKVKDASDYPDVQELLAASDLLITDYSSIMWDFSLQKKPVFLYHPDAELYKTERGFYIPFSEMPYVEAFNLEDLLERIDTFNVVEYKKKLDIFLKKYVSYDDGKASEKIEKVIDNVIDANL